VFPSLEETISWAELPYAEGLSYHCGSTIDDCGCAITSMVMMARGNGVTVGIDGEDVNPATLNKWLNENNGYSNGSIKWAKALEYFGRRNSAGKILTPFQFIEVKEKNLLSIKNAVRNTNQEVVTFTNKVNGGHYVLFTDYLEDEETFAIRDPWYFNTATFNQNADSEKQFDYDNSIDHSRIFAVAEPALIAGVLDVFLGSPAELRLTDSDGNVTGYQVDGVVEDIEKSGYFQEEIIGNPAKQDEYVELEHFPKRLSVIETDTEYTLEVIGTDEGEYSIDITLYTNDGDEFLFSATGTTNIGQIDTYKIDMVTGEVESISEEETEDVSRESFIELVKVAVSDQRHFSQKFFVRYAHRIFDAQERDKNKLARLRLRIFEKFLTIRDIEDEELDAAIGNLKEQLK
jgi:hypothetical protein